MEKIVQTIQRDGFDVLVLCDHKVELPEMFAASQRGVSVVSANESDCDTRVSKAHIRSGQTWIYSPDSLDVVAMSKSIEQFAALSAKHRHRGIKVITSSENVALRELITSLASERIPLEVA